MNKKIIFAILIFLNLFFIFCSINWAVELSNRKQGLTELALAKNELIYTINKNGLMKNCDLYENSTILINPNIFKNAEKINSINILINEKGYSFCYSDKINKKINKKINVHYYYNSGDKNEYLFLKKVVNNITCSDKIPLTETYSYCLKEDYILEE